MIENNQTVTKGDLQQNTTEDVVTFGGIIPGGPPEDFQDEGAFSFSDTVETPEEPEFSLFAGEPPAVSGRAAEVRAAKAHFALGDTSPGMDVLLNGIRNRTEEALRRSAAAQEDLKDIQAKQQAIRDKASAAAPVSLQDINEMSAIAKFNPKNDPSTIFERMYGKKYSATTLALMGGKNVVNDSFTKDPEGTSGLADITAEIVARQEIVKNALEDITAKYDKQGWGSFAVDVAKTFIPGYTTVKAHSVLTDAPGMSLLEGSTLEDKVNYLYSLPPAEMKIRLRETLDSLAEGNVTYAKEFAETVLKQSTSDRTWSNVFSGLDLLGLGATAKGAVKGVRNLIKTRNENKLLDQASSFIREEGELLDKGTKVLSDPNFETNKLLDQASRVLNPAEQAMKDAVKANASLETEPGDILSTMGDTLSSAKVNVEKRQKEVLGQHDPLNEGAGLRGIPSLANPEAVMKGSKANLSATATNDIMDYLRENVNNFYDAVSNSSKVPRLPEEALKVAFDEAEAAMKKRFLTGHTADAVVDIRFTRPDEVDTNVGAVSVILGRPDKSAFRSVEEAYQYGRHFYGLEMNPASNIVASATVEQQGVGFFIRMNKHLDETSPGVRAAMATGENVSSQGKIMNWVSQMWKQLNVASGDSKVSQFQNANRKTAVYGVSGLTDKFQDMMGTIASMSKDEAKNIRQIMLDNKYAVNPATKERGRYYVDQSDLEDNFSRLIGRLPNEKESKVYWTMIQLQDMELYMRNMAYHRDLSRMGVEHVRLFDESITPDGRKLIHNSGEFFGKIIDDIPWDNPKPYGFVVHRKGEEPKYKYLSPQASPEFRKEIEALKADGFQIIQVDPTRKVMGERFGNDVVSFIITKDHTRRSLDWNLIPRREGFHTNYENVPYFTKQPVLRKAGDPADPHHIYEGDTVLAGHRTKGEADRHSKAMEEARQMLKGNVPDQQLEEFLQKNLPYDLNEFKSLFKIKMDKDGKEIPAVFSADEPFMVVKNGQNTGDEYKGFFEGAYKGFRDVIRDDTNFFQNVDKKYVGKRDEPLQTVREGTESNPIFRFENMDEVDPLVTVNRAMSNIVRNRYFADYKISQVESWMSQYKDLLVGDRWSIENNPVFHIEQPIYNTKADPKRLADAEAARMAMVQLLGSQSDFSRTIENMRQSIVDSVYTHAGQGVSDPWSKALVGNGSKTALDPSTHLRKWTYQLRLGFYNPIPMFQNAVAAGNAIAISPSHGFQGFAAQWAMQTLRIAETPASRELAAKTAAAAGYNPKMFLEAWDEFKKSGARVVGNEHSFKDKLGDENLFSQGKEKFLDKGTVFFKEGELVSRMTAWNTAFREFRTANPNTVITDAIRGKILDRMDTMIGMMSRASHANYQQGLLSIPTQFWSYSARMTELTWGKKLTAAESTRLVAWNSLMYGIPVGGLGTAFGAFYDPYKDIKDYAVKKGVDTDSWNWTAFNGGVSGMAARLITGQDSAINEKLGPGGNSFFRNIFADQSFVKTIAGASGGVITDFAKSLGPGANALIALIRQEPSAFPFVVDDALEILRNVGSFSNAEKALMAWNTQKYVSKTGSVLTDDATKREALLSFLTGAEPGRVTSARSLQNDRMNIKKLQEKLEPEILSNYVRMMQAMNNGDEETSKKFHSRVNSLVVQGGWLPSEISSLMSKLAQNKDSMVIMERFLSTKRSPVHLDLELQRREQNTK